MVGLLFLFGGCGGSPDSADSSRILRLALGSEPPTLDWSLATDNVSFDVLTNIMEGLTQYDDDLKPVPAIAERWEFSEDGKTITFYLRDDVTWTDGSPVTAGQFEYSWKRLLNPATAAQYAYFLFDVVNAYEYNSGKIKDPDRVGVRALSPTVLEVKLKRPVIYFPSITTFMVTFPQRRDLIERYGNRWTDPENMVTNGPFRLVEWRHEYKLVLKANPRYYDQPPALDGVLEPAALTGLGGIDAVASFAGDTELRVLRQALAARDGALIPLISEPGQPERYTLERHVCVDTTAAGGNAALLADAGAA